MTVSSQLFLVTRRLFLEKSAKATAALAFSGLGIYSPRSVPAAEGTAAFIDLPCPQFPAWTPDGGLLVTFIAGEESGKILKTIRIETDLGDVKPELSAYAVVAK